MLVSFVFFGTQLSVAKIFHITEICSKVSFHDDQCILIQNTAVLKVFQNLTLQLMVIWGIHKYAVKNAFPSKERRACITSIFSSVPLSASFVNVRFSLMHVHALGFFFNKNSPSCSAA